jgi:phenylacetate-CoA ligase
MPSVYDKLYAKLPVWSQNLGVSAYGLVWQHRRFGGHFHRYLQGFKERERYSALQWATYQQMQLQRLLRHAFLHVPAYRKLLLQAGISLDDLDRFSLQHLTLLPLLEKEALRQDSSAFVSDDSGHQSLHCYLTSGTTGTPIAIFFSNDMHRKWSAAYEARVRHWAGVNLRMSRAMIGGRMVVPEAHAMPPFWRYNVVERQLYMSAFHISPNNVLHYVHALNHYKPDYLVGYASSHYFLARMILEQGLNVIRPHAILTSSEKLTEEMRSVIEQAYGCEVFDGYSGLEAACLASECEHHRLHLSPDVGIVELLDENGASVKPGNVGEIVATGLLNFDQPLIRYRTGDLAVLDGEKCPCGREMPVLKELVGRLEDCVIGADGREMVRFHGIFVGLPYVREGQIIQETVTDFTIRLVVDVGFGPPQEGEIRRRFQARLGKINLVFQLVDKIERTSRGKYRAVISKVPRLQ